MTEWSVCDAGNFAVSLCGACDLFSPGSIFIKGAEIDCGLWLTVNEGLSQYLVSPLQTLLNSVVITVGKVVHKSQKALRRFASICHLRPSKVSVRQIFALRL